MDVNDDIDHRPMSIHAANERRPKISVVMPTYNSEKYVKQTIQSILVQTFTDFELLIVNEYGSNDKTVEIAKSFNDTRIRIIQNLKKEGMAESLNIGIREAKGEYIARADSDDLYPENRFQEQAEYLDTHKDISILGSWQNNFSENDECLGSHKPELSHDGIKAALLFVCDLCHSSLMMRREDIIKNNLFYDKNAIIEDFELWTRACHVVKFANLPKVLSAYRVVETSRTNKYIEKLDYSQTKSCVIQIEKFLNIKIEEEDYILFQFWNHPLQGKSLPYIEKYLERENELFKKIWRQNELLKVYEPSFLEKSLRQRWKKLFVVNGSYILCDIAFFLDKQDKNYDLKVSVIIPTYNSEKYIKDSIDSILKQTFKDFEIIIVDDNSTDKTLKIIKNFRDKRIRVIQGPREGLAMALNVGIDAAQGEYIARMDSDDIALPERLEKQLGCMHVNPDIDICGSGALFWNQETGQKDFHQNPSEDIDIRTSLFFVCPIIHPTVMFRKKALNEHNLRYSSAGNGAEDLEFWLRAARLVKFHNMPDSLLIYRVHSSNVSITDGKNLKKFSHQLYQANYKKIFDIEIAEDIIGAFRPTERLDASYSLDQVLRIVKTTEDLIKKLKELKDKDKYNISMFEKTLLEGVQQIIQNNSANFAPLAK